MLGSGSGPVVGFRDPLQPPGRSLHQALNWFVGGQSLNSSFSRSPLTRYLADVTTHHTPLTIALSRPHTRVAIGAASEMSRHLYLETRAERGDDDVRANTSDPQFLRHVGTKPHHA